jgi:hypothetical protein
VKSSSTKIKTPMHSYPSYFNYALTSLLLLYNVYQTHTWLSKQSDTILFVFYLKRHRSYMKIDLRETRLNRFWVKSVNEDISSMIHYLRDLWLVK